jgi:hypothetical protein
MRLSFALFLSLLVTIASTCTQGFVIPQQQQATQSITKSRSQPLVQETNTSLFGSAAPPSRHRQLERTGSNKPVLSMVANPSLAVGFFGHSGLFLISVLLVRFVYKIFFPAPEGEQQPAGMLNRCPWPFVIFHDPKQFFKDSPTWMCVSWVILWRMTKLVAARKT